MAVGTLTNTSIAMRETGCNHVAGVATITVCGSQQSSMGFIIPMTRGKACVMAAVAIGTRAGGAPCVPCGITNIACSRSLYTVNQAAIGIGIDMAVGTLVAVCTRAAVYHGTGMAAVAFCGSQEVGMSFIITVTCGKAGAMACVTISTGAGRANSMGRVLSRTVWGGPAEAVAVVTGVQAAIGSNIDMAVLAVVIMDIKCGIQIDNGAGMTLTALSIGTDPGMILHQMLRKI